MKIKDLFKAVLFYGGLPHARILCRRVTGRQKIFILMYHRVAPKAPPFFESVIRPDIFERQIRFLKKHYNIASLEEIESAAFNDGGKDMVVITFDDGYRDNYIHAFPVLKRYDVPASVFL